MPNPKRLGLPGLVQTQSVRNHVEPACPERGGGRYCAPLNHVLIVGIKEYWACSCGRRYSRSGYQTYLEAHEGWEDR
jgi:hypothetical protein